jgi:hypothetical protein
LAYNVVTIDLTAARESASSTGRESVDLGSTYNVNRTNSKPDSRPETSKALTRIPIISTISSIKLIGSTSPTLKTILILTRTSLPP